MSEKDFDEQALEKEFNVAKKDYKIAREAQKEEIKKEFEDMKKSVDNSFGFIVKDVDDRSYPDKNWFGIDVTIEKDGENRKYRIAIQAYDKDQGSDNTHVLMDRLGVCEYDGSVPLSFDKIQDKMINTNIDLPMNPYKYDLLFAAINHYEEINKTCEDFKNARDDYIEARKKQQEYIKETLNKCPNFKVITPNNGRGGKGLPIYTNSGGIMPFDNSIWKYLDVVVIDDNDPEKIKAAFFISLQSFDKDSDAYVVFDKIGIYQYPPDMIENYNNATEKYKKKQ